MMPAEKFADISRLASSAQLPRDDLPLLDSQWFPPPIFTLSIARSYWHDIRVSA